jgi:ABC-type transport system substrate-binding protein
MTGAQEEPKTFFTLSLKAPLGNEVRMQVGALLAEELPKIGIGVELEYHDFPTLIELTSYAGETGATAAEGGVDIYLMGMCSGGDPIKWTNYFVSSAFEPHGSNIWRFSNGEVDALFAEANQMSDMEERKPLYWRIFEIVKENYFTIELYDSRGYMLKQDYVLNAEKFTKPVGYDTYYAYEWTIDGKTEADDTTIIYGNTAEPQWMIQPVGRGTSYEAYTLDIQHNSLHQHRYSVRDKDVQAYIPNLYTSYEVSDDGLVYTFHLRDDVKWHDGVKFTSADIKWNVDLIMDPDTGSGSHKSYMDYIDRVDTPDDLTAIFVFKKFHPDGLGFTNFLIMPKHILEDTAPADLLTSPYNTGEKYLPGLGPYKLIEWKKGEYMQLEAYDDYHLGRPFIDNFYIKLIADTTVGLAAFEAGEVDILPAMYGIKTEYDRLKTVEGIDLETHEGGCGQQLHVNLGNPILDNVNVRKAISHTIPREHITQDLAKGWASPLTNFNGPATSWGMSPNNKVTPYDLDMARGFMEDAGFNYDWLEPDVVPVNQATLPAAVGIAVGIAIGAIAAYILFRKPQ